MPLILFQRSVLNASPDDTVRTYEFDPSDDTNTITNSTVPTGTVGQFLPPIGTVIYQYCDGPDFIQYTTKLIDPVSSNPSALHFLNKIITEDSPGCCTINSGSFYSVKTNNTDLLTPNGTIVITAPLLTISDYEASIDSGDSWVGNVGSSITFSGLPGGNYNVIVREISGVCSVMFAIIIADSITYPPLIVIPAPSVDTKVYSPIFHPITLGYDLENNEASVKSDGGGTYLEADTVDARDYLASLPIIKIIDNEDYAGTYKINSVDNDVTPTKFYFTGVYTTDQLVEFVPFERQIFYLFAEKNTFNDFQKIANITVYSNSDGEYLMRIEGFLRAVFKIQPPVNNGDELTLLRKYYMMPQDFDLSDPAIIYNAVYSAIPDLTPFLSSLTPLGPAPINFINEQTSKGFPVLFSYIDTTTGRIKNVTSSQETNIVSTSPEIYIPGLPLNEYEVTWINPAGAITSLLTDPALPSWITLEASAADTVKLTIDTNLATGTGDYDGDDYDGDDYLTGSPNSIVGCYEYEFLDGSTLLFTLQICIFPIQKSHEIKCDGFNIAWINREGGWSSYIFGGKKSYGKEIGSVKTFKYGNELRKLSVEEVYDVAEVNISNLSIKDLVFISSLRQSIQAYLWSDATLQWSIPIVLDNQSFGTYSTPFKQSQVNDKFTFRFSEEIIIQSQ